MRSKLIAHGSYLPSKVVHNNDLSEKLETSHEWILERTGIEERRIADSSELTSDLATKALKEAVSKSGIDINSIDGVIVATCTPDLVFPSTAAFVQKKAGIEHALAFDINAVCSGFVYALSVADSMIRSGICKRIAVIGAETMSRIVDWNDRSTAILFGDGAGCFILEATNEDKGVLSSVLSNDPSKTEILKVDSGVSLCEFEKKLYMNGREVFKMAVEKMSEVALLALDKAGIMVDEVDWFLPHQANSRIISAIGDRLGLDQNKIINTVAKHANTSAASIPLAFAEAFKQGKIKSGNTIEIVALGAGISWGGVVFRV